MKAAVYYSPQKLQVEDLPMPEPEPSEVLIKVQYSAICGTDVHAFLYDIAPSGSVLGHEFSGVVAALGSDVTRWKVGDRVTCGGGTPPPGLEAPLRGKSNIITDLKDSPIPGKEGMQSIQF